MNTSFPKQLLHRFLSVCRTVRVPFGPLRGRRIRYHDDVNLDMLLGIHEPNSFAFFDMFVSEGSTVADIGANVGYLTIYFDKKVGRNGKVHAFEPIPSTFGRLRENAELNSLTNTIFVPKAASSSSGKSVMSVGSGHYMASLDSKWGGGRTVEVDTITIDDYVANTGARFDLIKVDIEGGAVWALEGMRKTIVNQQPVLFLESHTPQEDLAIGRALTWAPYKVFRVGSQVPVLHLNRDHTDRNGIYATVVGIPESKLLSKNRFDPAVFQKPRWGQR